MKRNHNKDFLLSRNEAYGIGLQSMATDVECDTTFYDHPTSDQEAIATERNEAYGTNVQVIQNVDYATNMTTERTKLTKPHHHPEHHSICIQKFYDISLL